jgi:phenylpropionate dioxygenase-like ring-hydroxylating dioxygenase large terminal subunit
MMKPLVNREEPLKNGLRNYWYPLAKAAALTSKPLRVRALGEELVLWRDSRGRAHVMRDRCPHRDTRLSLGEVVGDVLACAYHGMQFDASGQCVAVPTEGGDCPLAQRLRVPTYPCEERAGLVWGYIGDVALFQPPPLRMPEELDSAAWSGFVQPATWRTNWLRVWDNLADPMHGPYLHARSFTLSRGRRADRMRVEELPDGGILIEREGQRGLNFDWIEVHQTGPLWCRLDIPYPRTAGPGPNLRIVGFVTPLDDQATTVYFFRQRQVSGWRRWLWRGLYHGFLEYKHWLVLEQDRAALEAQRGIESRLHEHLAQSDVGVVRMRRFFQQELARQQAVYAQAASGEAAPPVGAPEDVAESSLRALERVGAAG